MFRRHFARLGAARETAFRELYDVNAKVLASRVVADVDFDVLPSRCALTLVLAKAKMSKAAGESTLASDAFRLCPREFTKLLHPLITKSLVNAECPLQWKGAQLIALYKGKGAHTAITSYRDISITDPRQRCMARFFADS